MTTDIFYAQNKNLVKLNKLLKEEKFNSFNTELKTISKDTIFYTEKEKNLLYYILATYYNKKDKKDHTLSYLKKIEEFYYQKKKDTLFADVQYDLFLLLKAKKNLISNDSLKKFLDNYFNFAISKKDNKRILKSYMGYAGLSINPKKYKNALKFYDKAIKTAVFLNDSITLAKIYSNKGVIIKHFYKNLDSARYFYKKALHIYSKKNKRNESLNICLNISGSFKKEKNYQEAIEWLIKADSIPITSYKINSKKFLYRLMSKNYEELADFKNANLYLNKYIAYKDSVDIKAQNIAISDIQTKYETAKKEKDIIKLKAEKDKQQNYMIIGAGSFVFIIILTILAFYNQKKKKDLAEKNRELEHQKLDTLIKEQELKTLDAIVQGQEKERKRIAEDLHDNLGSKLAVLKLQFDSFLDNKTTKSNTLLTTKLKKTSSLLEDTYQTVRSMSHAESKNKVQQSLLHAVKVLTTDISNANKLEIEVIDFGLEKLNNNKIEIITLRIIQELLTNIIKYAKAEKVTIDITFYDNLLGVIISDDGIGFDVKLLKKEGLGLITIKEKVKKLNGSINIDSSLGNGSTIIIEIPVN